MEYAKRLQQLGHDVIVVSRVPVDEEPCFPVEVPLIHESYLDSVAANADAIIATAFDTVETVLRCNTSARRYHFIQNREAYFAEHPRVQQWIEGHYSLPLIPITISHWLAAVIKLHGKDSFVIHNGLDTSVFTEVPGLRPSAFRIIAEGQWTPWKRLDLGIEAARKAGADEVVSLSVKSIPPGVDAALTDVTTEEIVKAYSSASAMVKLSDFEGYPAPQAEAMACGCSVVTTRAPGTIEYCVDGENCLLVPQWDVDAAAEALRRLKDPALRRKLVEGGKQTVRELFTWDDKVEMMSLALSGKLRPSDLPCPFHTPEEQEYLVKASEPYTLPYWKSVLALESRAPFPTRGLRNWLRFAKGLWENRRRGRGAEENKKWV